jgi:two-component system, OmpR family, KDP operon response regulator KdpE
MDRSRILIADDERELRRMVRLALERHDYAVREAETGQEAIVEFARYKPDVLLLDLVLPDLTGVEVCREIRRTQHQPIIVLSVVQDEAMKIAALDAGADDYVTKPFGIGELLARVRVALRRGVTERDQRPIIRTNGLSVDLEKHRVDVDHRHVHLTPTEFSLLRYFATNAGRLLTHKMILKAVWGEEHAYDVHVIRTYINQLRSKLGDDDAGSVHRFIETEPGIGYRFVEPDDVLAKVEPKTSDC